MAKKKGLVEENKDLIDTLGYTDALTLVMNLITTSGEPKRWVRRWAIRR